MLNEPVTERGNPATANVDALSTLEIVQRINAEDAKVAAAVHAQQEAIAAAIDAITVALRGGGRLVYIGAGTSGRLGVLDASECPPTFRCDPSQVVGLIAGGPTALTTAVEGAEDDPAAAVTDLQAIGFTAADCLVGIATSGRTPYVLGAVQWAASRGATTIGLACNPDSELARCVQIMITPVVGPEVITGSTRMKAGTATKMVLNMLSTGAMVRLGKTYGNAMVDLRASNSKLIDRARRLVARLTGVSPAEAQDLLDACGGEVKTAVVMHHRDVDAATARQQLAACEGHLRQVIGSVPQMDQ
ncbi:N-acetylmuramic acid 6-phosphate etherase [Roseimaritima sediminicola]|uniref:N-acetylmuramic acid 6-phosphate etherase n=1 Tax=Roseimaritima sediminicola TaxID=2662066 RepID=UPI0012984D08|nr:N-acetylmuramic acid 6-phosphate etherase [Roseimaritima sediminicola]